MHATDKEYYPGYVKNSCKIIKKLMQTSLEIGKGCLWTSRSENIRKHPIATRERQNKTIIRPVLHLITLVNTQTNKRFIKPGDYPTEV